MNPNVKQIVKAIPIVVGTVVILFLWDYIRSKLSVHIQDQLENALVYVVIAGAFEVGAIAVVYIFSNLFYEIYTETILQRAERIVSTAVDEKEEYLYVAADCYQSGDENGAGFYIHRFYLFDLATGKKFLYEGKKNSSHEAAIHFFNTILKKEKPIQFKITESNFSLTTKSYTVKIIPFRTRIDFGFQIVCRNKEIVLWKYKI